MNQQQTSDELAVIHDDVYEGSEGYDLSRRGVIAVAQHLHSLGYRRPKATEPSPEDTAQVIAEWAADRAAGDAIFLTNLDGTPNGAARSLAAALASASVGDVQRGLLRVAVGGVLFNAMNYPEPVQSRILGQDTRPLTEKVVDAVLSALVDAAEVSR